MKTVSILGSTGSVGAATVDVIQANRDRFAVAALTANRNVAGLAAQARMLNAQIAVVADESCYSDLKDALSGSGIKAAAGRQAVIDAASIPADITMAAIVGMAGLAPLMAAIANGAHVAIANKEPLVAAGPQVMDAAQKSGATLLPVDSEHNAVFQIFDPAQAAQISRIVLTASGGPFRDWSAERMTAATPAQAVNHPNWSMGAKISVDSATMMNKALEVIEAQCLFKLAPEKIDVLLHPQSTIHAMVEYADGSVLAHLGAPDMRVPITHALGWPDRISGPAQRLDLTKLSCLTFEQVDHGRFPAINYAYRCMDEGQAACIAFNAANEVAVESFLAGCIGFADIFETVRRSVESLTLSKIESLADVAAVDSKVRDFAQSCILNTETTPDRKVS